VIILVVLGVLLLGYVLYKIEDWWSSR